MASLKSVPCPKSRCIVDPGFDLYWNCYLHHFYWTSLYKTLGIVDYPDTTHPKYLRVPHIPDTWSYLWPPLLCDMDSIVPLLCDMEFELDPVIFRDLIENERIVCRFLFGTGEEGE